METLMTKGIQITVEPHFQINSKHEADQKFLFTYEIEISNQSQSSVQLLERYWTIFDSLAGIQTVNGPGVIGKKPVLEPGESFEYASWCPLHSEIGYMEGYYLMQNLDDGSYFEVWIPRFMLIASYKLN